MGYHGLARDMTDQVLGEGREEAALGALREAELRYRTIADSTYDWVYWEAPDGTLRYVSPSCERITGYPAEEFLANPHLITELVLPEDREAWAEHHRTAQRRQSGGIQFRIRRPDGDMRWIEHVCQPVTDGQGTFLGYRANNRDITERKRVEDEIETYRERLEELVAERTAELAEVNAILRKEIAERKWAEEALKRGEERYTLAQRAANIGSWDWDIGTGDLHWSERIEPMFGFGRGEFGASYEAFLECVHPEDRQRVIDAVDASLERGEDYAIEHRIVWPDGTVRWVSETGDVIRDERGQPIRMLGIVQDITERLRAEETRSRLAAIVESSDDAIISKTLTGRILSWNSGAERIYGYTAEEATGQPISILLPPDRPDEVAQILERIRQGEHVAHSETVRVRQDGEQIHVSLNISPIYDEEGAIIGASSIARDISERKQAERALRQAKEVAEKARQEEQKRRQEAERRRRIAESLGDVLTVLNSNRPLDEVLNHIAVQAGQLLGTRAAGIYSLESETGEFSVQATRGLLVTYVAGARVPIGQGALQRAMASRRPVAIPDLDAALADGGDPALGVEHGEATGVWARVYRALLAVPVVVQGEVYGGMLLYYAEPRTFSEEEVELAVALCEQVALAIGNARLREQVEQTATAAERDRLARELHDAVTQTLFSASLIAEAMPRVWERDLDEGRRGLEELRRLTRGAAAEMRTMLVELRPAALTEKPLGELLRHLTEAMTGRTRVPIELRVDGYCTLPPEVQIALYRIVQEALNNVAKHAGASQVTVDLSCQPLEAALSICDDGCGFDLSGVPPDRFGLGFMRERAQGIGAVLEINSRTGQGTRITVNWPETRRG